MHDAKEVIKPSLRKYLHQNDHNSGHLIGGKRKEDYHHLQATTLYFAFLISGRGSDLKCNIFKHLPYPSQQNPQLEAVYTVPMQCCIVWTASSKSSYHQLHLYQ